jgi:hypothetical protein
MPKRSNLQWTPQDEMMLRNLVEKGFYLRQLSLRLCRSESSIKKRAIDLKIQIKPTPRYRVRSDPRAFGYKDAHN